MRSSTVSPSLFGESHVWHSSSPPFFPSGGLTIGAKIWHKSNESRADLWHQNNAGQGSFERWQLDQDLLSSFPASSIGFHRIGRRGVSSSNFVLFCLINIYSRKERQHRSNPLFGMDGGTDPPPAPNETTGCIAGRCVYIHVYEYSNRHHPSPTHYRKMYIKFACACAQTWGNAHVNYRHHPFSIRWASIANPTERYRPSTAGCRLYAPCIYVYYIRPRSTASMNYYRIGIYSYVCIHVWRGVVICRTSRREFHGRPYNCCVGVIHQPPPFGPPIRRERYIPRHHPALYYSRRSLRDIFLFFHLT